MAQKQCKRRHDNVARRVIGNSESMDWKAQTGGMSIHLLMLWRMMNEELYWDLTVQTDMTVVHNRPDIILVEKAIWKWTIIDIAVPSDFNVARTEDWKVEKYQDLAFEAVKRIHHVEKSILPVVIGDLGTVPNRLFRSMSF